MPLLCALAFAATAALGQGATAVHPVSLSVNGQVRYATTKQPAERALVRLEAFGSGVVGEVRTDQTGKFQFTGLRSQQYILTVHAAGYRDYQQTVDLLTATHDYVSVMLVADPSAAGDSPPTGAGHGAVVDASIPAEARAEFEKGSAEVAATKKRDRYERGLRHLERAVAIYPNFLEAHLLLGIGYMDLQQWEKAEASLRRAIEINPKATTAYFALGEVLRRGRRYEEAERALKDGLRLDPRSSRGYYELGRVLYDRGDIVRAGPQVGRAIQLRPEFAEAHLLAGNILLRARQPGNALAEFEEYLRLDPKGEYAEEAREVVRRLRRAGAKD